MKVSTMARGRIAIYCPGHPKANSRGYVLRARYIIEKSLGRYLLSEEVVHHINGDKTDDRLENLQVMSQQEHGALHGGHGRGGGWRPRTLDYLRIAELRSSGLGYKRIAKELGYSRSSVRDACHRMNMGAC